MTTKYDEYFMKVALKEAQTGFEKNEIPIGAVVADERNNIIAKAHNQTVLLCDPTAHAEMLAITAACNHLGSPYLNQCTLYVTLEPCNMCAGALYWSKIGKLVYGARDNKRGYNSVYNCNLHPRTRFDQGIFENESSKLLTNFFYSLRKK